VHCSHFGVHFLINHITIICHITENVTLNCDVTVITISHNYNNILTERILCRDRLGQLDWFADSDLIDRGHLEEVLVFVVQISHLELQRRRLAELLPRLARQILFLDDVVGDLTAAVVFWQVPL